MYWTSQCGCAMGDDGEEQVSSGGPVLWRCRQGCYWHTWVLT